ncbi:helix-turn-helix transcriptional regulator [Salinicola peritrichatus]|uniref:helix-turn-helix transcriptional regulator n=1 Tax=Salinicola peritrichatus TaxID=1267424 RepID=UPI000DA19459|nr:helix-turn-helix transcriptional regulator [Salinicola peritrichatus]
MPCKEDVRHEIGNLLRSRRERLTPAMVNLPDGGRRRTPGLRREEVAQLANISVDWYIRLEQGRGTTPSAATIKALAEALRLDAAETRHLQALAQSAEQPRFSREVVPETLLRMLDDMEQPSYLTGQRWDLLAWNSAADDIFDFTALSVERRNILLYMFIEPAARSLFGNTWEREAQRMLAQFRAIYDFWSADPAFIELLSRLQRDSAEFDQWWTTHDIRHPRAGHKHLSHPIHGELHFAYANFQSNDDPAIKLSIYTRIAS